MDDVDVLAAVLAEDLALIRGVRADQLRAPTPCGTYDVEQLVRHATGWLQEFAAGANGREPGGDPESYRGDDPAVDFERASAEVVEGWRVHGTDRPVRFAESELPGSVVLAITLMEYATHGGDLALALGLPAPFTEEESSTALAMAQQVLLPEHRDGDSFGPEVPVDDRAPAFDRLMAFMGRGAAAP